MAGTNLIVGVEAVRERMSLQNLDEINSIISSGLTSAQVFFESILGSPFSVVTSQTDVFLIDPTMFSAYGGVFRLRLKRMFILPGSITVYYANTMQGALLAEAQVVPATDYVVDYERGIIYLNESYGFSAGFGVDNPAPEWLVEAVLTYMPAVVINQAGSNSDQKQAITSLDIKKMAASMVDGKNRINYPQFRPVF